MAIDWPSKIASLDTHGLKALLENAQTRDVNVAALCEAELARRKPSKVKKIANKHLPDDFVIGFHLKCDKGQGVTKNADGTYWTGTWVIDEDHAENAPKIDAYVALHDRKSEASYLQGRIKDWRKAKRERQYAEGQIAKTPFGVDFLFVETSKPYQWFGDGSGERGYRWFSDGPADSD